MKRALYAAVAVAVLSTAVSAEILEQVLVKVNGEIITQTEFHKIQLAAVRELQNQPDATRLTDAELSKTLAQITPQAIVTLIDEMLLMQRATELGLAVSDAQFAQVLDSISKDNKIESEESGPVEGGQVSDRQLAENGEGSNPANDETQPMPQVTDKESGASPGGYFKDRDYKG